NKKMDRRDNFTPLRYNMRHHFGMLLVLFVFSAARADDWPQWLGPKRDGVWRETGLLDKFPAKGPKTRWKVDIGSGYAGPAVADGKVYTLGAMGDLLCLDANKGTVVWSKNFPKDYEARVPMWGFCSSPLLDGDKLICLVGGKGSTVVAFHKDTGKEIWKALDA